MPTLRLHTSRPVKARVERLDGDRGVSPRLVVDVPAPVAARAANAIGGAGVVRQVRVERVGRQATRIVVELAEAVPYRVRQDDRLVAIELGSAPAVVAAAAVAPVPPAVSSAAMTPEQTPESSSAAGELPEPALGLERGVRFAWPDLDASYYREVSAAPERLALKAWRQGATTLDAPATHGGAATLYLAADVTFLRTLLGKEEPLAAPLAYERALRAGPTFPDAPRALVMLGLTNLRLGFAPEADLAFDRVLREHPESPYVAAATLWRAAALRERHRLDEARATLAPLVDHAPASLRCDVLVEQAALARDATELAEAARLDERLARDCPRHAELASAIEARATTLVDAGRRAEARALLSQPAPTLSADDQARLVLHAADLAREDGDFDEARRGLERVLGMRVSAAVRVLAQAEVARLDGRVGPDHAVATLEGLATIAPTPAVRADVLAVTAETLADAGRFDDALARLDADDDIDGAARARLDAHRDAILARWIAERTAAGDPIGVATVYAAHRTAIDTRASRATALQVASALGGAGLNGAALRLLRLRQPSDDAAFALTVGEAGLEAGQTTVARDTLARVPADGLAPDVAARRRKLAARVAIADGALDAVTAPGDDPVVARELAAAWLARGDAALGRDAWDDARAAYERARDVAGERDQRTAATAGLVAASVGAGTGPEPIVDELAAIDEPVVRQGVALLAATRPFGGAVVPAVAIERGRAR